MPAHRSIGFPASIVVAAFAASLLAACATPSPAPPPAPVVQTPVAKPAPEPKPVLRPSHPMRYVVKKGDTLWDISKHFLKSPWLWPDIWYVNPQVRNPHLIYPGDIIELRFVNGRPQLTLAQPTKHLHPRVRATPIEQAVPTIPLAAIKAFLNRPRVVSRDELDGAPYVLASADGRMLSGSGSKVYVRGIGSGDGAEWTVIRRGDPLVDPDTHDILGYQARYIGAGVIEQRGDPAAMRLTASRRGVKTGDRLVPYNDAALPANFYPQAPEQAVNGRIISVFDGVSQVGQYQIVVLNKGTRAGLKPGSVLAIYQRSRSVEDPYNGADVKLPDQRAGVLMVFRTFDRVSYALVMEATSEIHVLDLVRKP